MLGRLENLALFESDMRIEPLAELCKQRWSDRTGVPEHAKSVVVLSDSPCERRFPDGLEAWKEVLLLYLEMRLQMVRERLEHQLPHQLGGPFGVGTSCLSAASSEHQTRVVVVREIA